MAQPDSEGWIEWAGGECPVDYSRFVSVRFRNGSISECAPPWYWIDRWSNRWAHTGPDRGDDITAYRSVQS